MRALWQRLQIALDDQLWLRPALASLLSLGIVLFAAVADQYLWLAGLPIELGESALAGLFSIFASSMLAVATFSVSAIVTAVSSVSNSTTPRAEQLVLADKTAQTVLASFITAFIYSVIGLLALEVFAFGQEGRLVLFAGLAGIMAWVLVSFLAWVNHVTGLGRVSSTIDRIEAYAMASAAPSVAGSLGARLRSGLPSEGARVVLGSVGYVSTIDFDALQRIAERLDTEIHLAVRPGDFIDARAAVAMVVPLDAPAREDLEAIAATISVARQHGQTRDLRFAVGMLAETADRALSPGINDPGTAIAILGVLLRVLTRWADHCADGMNGGEAVAYPNVHIPELPAHALVRDGFAPIARDGAGMIEVCVSLQKTLEAVARLGHPGLVTAACDMSRTAAAYADKALVLPQERETVAELAKAVQAVADTEAAVGRLRQAAEGDATEAGAAEDSESRTGAPPPAAA